MIRLLKIEFKKIMTYKIFWTMLGLYCFFLPAGLLMAEFMINNMINDTNHHSPIPLPHVQLYFFPWVWQNITFFASIRYVLIFPAIVIIILVTNEYTFKTIRQNMINGLSKAEFLASKLLLILLISIVVTLLLAIAILVLGLSNTSGITLALVLKKSSFIVGFFIMIFSFQVLGLFFGFLFRSTGFSIALFTLWAFIAEPIFYYLLKAPFMFKNDISPYLPVNAILRVTEYPAIPFLNQITGKGLQDSVSLTVSLIPLLYSAVMIGIIFWILKKRDL